VCRRGGKVKVKIKFTIQQATNVQRESRGIALFLFKVGARWGWVVSATPRPLYSWERPGTDCIGGWVGPKAGLNGCGKSRPIGIRSPDRPACSESLYRLSNPGFIQFPCISQNYRNLCRLVHVKRNRADIPKWRHNSLRFKTAVAMCVQIKDVITSSACSPSVTHQCPRSAVLTTQWTACMFIDPVERRRKQHSGLCCIAIFGSRIIAYRTCGLRIASCG
jgi:hypothetical protein